jgi:hypothetical protein
MNVIRAGGILRLSGSTYARQDRGGQEHSQSFVEVSSVHL